MYAFPSLFPQRTWEFSVSYRLPDPSSFNTIAHVLISVKLENQFFFVAISGLRPPGHWRPIGCAFEECAFRGCNEAWNAAPDLIVVAILVRVSFQSFQTTAIKNRKIEAFYTCKIPNPGYNGDRHNGVCLGCTFYHS
jgi:hypothetical protein